MMSSCPYPVRTPSQSSLFCEDRRLVGHRNLFEGRLIPGVLYGSCAPKIAGPVAAKDGVPLSRAAGASLVNVAPFMSDFWSTGYFSMSSFETGTAFSFAGGKDKTCIKGPGQGRIHGPEAALFLALTQSRHGPDRTQIPSAEITGQRTDEVILPPAFRGQHDSPAGGLRQLLPAFAVGPRPGGSPRGFMNQDEIRIEGFQRLDRETESLQCRIVVPPDQHIRIFDEFGKAIFALLRFEI